MTACPECAGEQMVGHPAGVLAIQHNNECTLHAAEDATAAADYSLTGWRRTRPITDTERVLLAALGYAVPDQVCTEITRLTTSVLHRAWPDLTLIPEETPA